MKREQLMPPICAWVLSFCLAFGGAACMVTALRLSCSLTDLAVCLLPVCLLLALLLSVRRGGFVVLALVAVTGFFGLYNETFKREALSMAAQIAQFYQSAYNLVLPEAIGQVTQESHLMPLLIFSAGIAGVVCWAMLHRIPLVLGVFLSVLPVGLCCVVTDTVPELWCILLWLGALALLLLTHPVRLQSDAEGAELTGILAIPVAAAVAVLAIAMPEAGYEKPRLTLSDLEKWFSGSTPYIGQTSDGELVISFGSDLSDRVDLERLPAGEQGNSPVMEVLTDFSGTLYLRGQDHDLYDGKSWSSSPDREESDFLPEEDYLLPDGTVSVRMLSRQSRFYFPYWPSQPVTLIGGAVDNTEQVTAYSYTRLRLTDDWHADWTVEQKWDASLGLPSLANSYLELPEQTKQRAQEFLDQIHITGDVIDRAKIIADFVRSSAEYDLDAPQMPPDAEDFAAWFLTEAETGYCSHFATATAVLLRAAGIPARYVEGFMTEVRSRRPNIIREDKAHAWVEYYVDGLGWLVLESTPGYGEETPAEVTDPTGDTTKPSETTRPTETTEATEPATTEPTVTEPSTDAAAQTEPVTGTVEQPKAVWLPKLLLWLGVVLGTAALVAGQWYLRLRWRHRRQYRGSPNDRAIARFREAKRLAKLSGLPVPEELSELADKACFSQHKLTAEELSAFSGYLRQAVAQLRKAPLWKRLVYRIVFAAY